MHLKYLKYLIIHKYFVFVAGRVLGLSKWRLLIHDWSKFLPCEWFSYVEYFYGNKMTDEEIMDSWRREQSILGYRITPSNELKQFNFDVAWNHHQKSNKHHYQYWILICDSGEIKPIEMPDKYRREMVADWAGAGRAITGKWDFKAWYNKNRANIVLHDRTRGLVEEEIEELDQIVN